MSLSKTFLALGIAVVFAAFISYGINVIYEPPPYDYSSSDCYLKYNCNKPIEDCQNKYVNQSYNTPQISRPPPEYRECYSNYSVTQEFKSCQMALDKCNEEFTKNSPQYSHARNTFFIMLFIGLASIVGGSALKSTEGVGSGFIGGGVLVILLSIIQSGVYVYSLDKYIKLTGLGIALAVLIYIGYKMTDGKKK